MTNVRAAMLKINPGIVFGGGGGGEWEKGAGTRNIVWSVFPCPASPPLLHLPPAFCSLLSLRGLGVGEDHLLSPAPQGKKTDHYKAVACHGWGVAWQMRCRPEVPTEPTVSATSRVCPGARGSMC